MSVTTSRITIFPEVCGGHACIRGLRICVKEILNKLVGGAKRQDIVLDYPYLENEGITAVMDYASCATNHPVIA